MPVVATLSSSPVATAAMRRLLLVSSRNRRGITIPILVSMQGTVRRGPIFEVTDRNDPVIEEGYKDYVVPGDRIQHFLLPFFYQRSFHI